MLSATANHRRVSGTCPTLVTFALIRAGFAHTSPGRCRNVQAQTAHSRSGAEEKALATIQDTYKEDYDKDKAVLAQKLIQKAKETQDATERFVLLGEAKNLAVETFQSDLAFEAIDELASKYDVSIVMAKAEVIEKAAKNVRTIHRSERLPKPPCRSSTKPLPKTTSRWPNR